MQTSDPTSPAKSLILIKNVNKTCKVCLYTWFIGKVFEKILWTEFMRLGASKKTWDKVR